MNFFINLSKELLFLPVIITFHGFKFFLFVDFGLDVGGDHLEVFAVHFGEFDGEALEIELDGFASAYVGGVDVADFGEVL